jgi:hypothetical protein
MAFDTLPITEPYIVATESPIKQHDTNTSLIVQKHSDELNQIIDVVTATQAEPSPSKFLVKNNNIDYIVQTTVHDAFTIVYKHCNVYIPTSDISLELCVDIMNALTDYKDEMKKKIN